MSRITDMPIVVHCLVLSSFGQDEGNKQAKVEPDAGTEQRNDSDM